MTREVIVRTTRDRIKQLLDDEREQLTLDVISPGVTPVKLANVDYGMNADIAGIVRQIDSVHEFERSDGTPGQVRGIRIQDATADLRCALWGDHADTELELGDPILIRNAGIEDGWEDDIEASVGYSQEIEVLDELEIDFVTIELRGGEGMAESEPSESSESPSEPSDSDATDDSGNDETPDEDAADPVEDGEDGEDGSESVDDDDSDDGGSQRRFDITRGNK